MRWKRGGRKPRPPWYRRADYKGDLTEEEKHRLDALRAQDPHPANTYDDLPEAVRSYISKIEIELYDLKQDQLAAGLLMWIAIGALLVLFNYLGRIGPIVLTETSNFGIVLGLAAIVGGIIWYSRRWKQNADELLLDDQIFQEWELVQIARWRSQEAYDDL